ncbi:MAG TPA: hypothetical protein VFP49_01710 [Nitrososphaeraceae archaeon]|nr:hypothetical protein [Nitrososphaeraceae archaeon]
MYNKIELQTKFNLIHEKESTGGDTVTDICAILANKNSHTNSLY